MLPGSNDHINEVAKERYKDEERWVVSKSCRCNWEDAIIRLFKKLFRKG